MNKFYRYFLQKSLDSPLIIQRKAKALVTICLSLTITALSLFTLSIVLKNPPMRIAVFGGINILFILTLIILKKYGYHKAGNFFSIGIILGSIAALNLTGSSEPLYTSYISGFYIIFGMLVVSGLFSTRKIQILNTFLIISGVLFMYFRVKHLYPEVMFNVEDLAGDAIIRFFIVLITLFFAMDYMIRTNKSIIDQMNTESKINKEQNMQLNKIIGSVQNTAESLNKLSNELNKSIHELKSSSEEQSKAVKSVSTIIDIILRTIMNNAQKSQEAIKIAESTDKLVGKGNQALKTALDSVENISTKITIIKDIADKTDILSINASIEATNSGEAGKGFSVVAKEIRKLADISNKESVDIIELANYSSKASDNASVHLVKMLDEIRKSTDFIKEISHSTIEQKSGIRQISSSIMKLDKSAENTAELADYLQISIEVLQDNVKNLQKLLK